MRNQGSPLLALLHPGTLLLVLYDLTAVVAAAILGNWLRFEALRPEFLLAHLPSLPLVLATYLVSFIAFRLYRHWWQYAGVELLRSIMLATGLATLISIVWQVHLDGKPMPRSLTLLSALLIMLLIGGQRVLLRVVFTAIARLRARPLPDAPWSGEPKRTIIMADGHSAVEVLIALEKDSQRRYDLLGILLDDPRHHGSHLRGVRVIGPLSLLHDLLRRHAVDEVIIALPDADDAAIRAHVLACCHAKVAVRVAPVLATLLDNPSAARGRLRLHDLRVEDLLHRPSLQADVNLFGDYLTGARVLVSGAGGSIGSELCRQICHLNPALLVLLGHGENSIHQILLELRRAYLELDGSLVPVICDVRDAARVQAIIGHFRPHVIFHAAAHKHVPLMEENVVEAITNNIGGTRNMVRAASAHGVERMVLVSTDKAVNPSSIMGASKFLCEEVLRAESERSPTCFLTVRFGNVLGSRGSVVPIFQEQIHHGGPITVTHPEMKRFFMTIPEAVSLVLRAGASQRSGGLFVLDMGDPVRIVDMAENLIRLSGLEPYRDIGIEFSGLRAGEKLEEELLSPREMRAVEMDGPLMMVDRPQYLELAVLDARLDMLLAVADRNQDHEARKLLIALVPSLAGYAPSGVVQRVA